MKQYATEKNFITALKNSDDFVEAISNRLLENELDSLLDKIKAVESPYIAEFMNSFENAINKACQNKRNFLKNNLEDCKQFIRISLGTIYKNQYKYDDFDVVVYSMINRRLKDFTKKDKTSSLFVEQVTTGNNDEYDLIKNAPAKTTDPHIDDKYIELLDYITNSPDYICEDVEAMTIIIEGKQQTIDKVKNLKEICTRNQLTFVKNLIDKLSKDEKIKNEILKKN
jgi:hypothetical protein